MRATNQDEFPTRFTNPQIKGTPVRESLMSDRDDTSVILFAEFNGLILGFVIDNDGFFLGRTERLAALTARGLLPSIFQYRAFVAAGGLMSYGPSILESLRMMTSYISRVLKGEKPAELPVAQPTGVELIINLKTAKMFGLTVPTALLLRADEVIE